MCLNDATVHACNSTYLQIMYRFTCGYGGHCHEDQPQYYWNHDNLGLTLKAYLWTKVLVFCTATFTILLQPSQPIYIQCARRTPDCAYALGYAWNHTCPDPCCTFTTKRRTFVLADFGKNNSNEEVEEHQVIPAYPPPSLLIPYWA